MEIGCGQGFLTERLLATGAAVHGVEVDQEMTAVLWNKFKNQNHFFIHSADILTIDLNMFVTETAGKKIKIAGNLPYHITSPIIFRCFDYAEILDSATFMVQREVARRIVAAPGSKDYGILSVFCKYHAACRILFDVSPNAFYPKPGVVSSVVHMRFRSPAMAPESYQWFKTIVRTAFNRRRKMLRNSLSDLLPETAIAFDLQRRPETLTMEEFIALSRLIPREANQ